MSTQINQAHDRATEFSNDKTRIEAMEARLRIPPEFRADPDESGSLAQGFSSAETTREADMKQDLANASVDVVSGNDAVSAGVRLNVAAENTRAQQNNQLGGKNGKKGKAKDDFLVRMHMMQRQAQYWADQAEKYEAQSDALDMAIENVRNGKGPTDGMSMEEKQNFLDAVQEYKEKYGLTGEEVDLSDPDTLEKIKAFAEENHANAKTLENDAQELLEKAQNAETPEQKQAVIEETIAAGFEVSDKATTEAGDNLEFVSGVDKQNGFDTVEQEEAIDFFNDNALDQDVSSALSLFGSASSSSTSHASTLDDQPPLSDQTISLAFNSASMGAETPAQEVGLEQTRQTATPQVITPGLG